MTVGRRRPPPKPPKMGPPAVPQAAEDDVKALWGWAMQTGGNLDALWEYVRQGYDGLPAPHSFMHAASGSDPITGATEDSEFLALIAFMET